jgi:hypothetical protein
MIQFIETQKEILLILQILVRIAAVVQMKLDPVSLHKDPQQQSGESAGQGGVQCC